MNRRPARDRAKSVDAAPSAPPLNADRRCHNRSATAGRTLSAHAFGSVPDVLRLFPGPPAEVSVEQAARSIDAEPRTDTTHHQPTWVLTNMIGSLDGASALSTRSGGLGSTIDRQMLAALRARADVIVVGAATVRAERYRPPSTPTGAAATARTARSQRPTPRLCVVTRSGNLPNDLPLFRDRQIGDERPIVATTEAGAARIHAAATPDTIDVIAVGGDDVRPDELLAELGRRGHRVVLCEGGPTLLGQLVAADLVDEWNLTVSPSTVGGRSSRVATADIESRHAFALAHVLLDDDGLLYLRHVRTR